MRLSESLARLSMRDVQDLAIASDRLARVADWVRSARRPGTELVIAEIITVNDVICRIQAKGAASAARYLERRGIAQPGRAADPGETQIDAHELGAALDAHDKEDT